MQEDLSNDEDEEEDVMKTMQGESVTTKQGECRKNNYKIKDEVKLNS